MLPLPVRFFHLSGVHFSVAQLVYVLIQARLRHDLSRFHVHKVLGFEKRLLGVLLFHNSLLEFLLAFIFPFLLGWTLTLLSLDGLFRAQVIFHQLLSGCGLVSLSLPHELHLAIVFELENLVLALAFSFHYFLHLLVTKLLLEMSLLTAQNFLLQSCALVFVDDQIFNSKRSR